MKQLLFFVAILFYCGFPQTQDKNKLTDADRSALEEVIVEKYYTSNLIDYVDTIGNYLPKGSVTYRIFIDLKPGYSLQSVYGSDRTPLIIKTSTEFFNNTSYGVIKGDYVDDKKINENTVALDSWVTVGAATRSHYGILRSDDKDGSIIKNAAFAESDGLIAGKVRPVIYVGVDLDPFYGSKIISSFSTNDGAWAVWGGVKGPTEENRVLIAQLTTNGILTFDLNIQIGTPTGVAIRYVAGNPDADEIQFKGLVRR